ncbi:hypothetical protein AYO44_15770 [Planctomycetaceae bacterium SCGC AG-212-F19]|nr:hypothetical protein AYO44_15770 [Planctomycetaceae bacterium SCGC AG-212-F19]
MPQGPLAGVFRHIRRLVGLTNSPDQTDSELLRRFSDARDDAAFASLVHRHGPLVWNVCRRVLGTDADADDAFQATFLVLARQAGSIRQGESVGSWLYGVAYRVAAKAKVQAARRRVHERRAAPMAAARTNEIEVWEDIRPLLDEEMNRLPEKYRVPIVLRYLQGKSNAQAARELGWPTGSMSWRLARGLELLRDRLGRRGVTLGSGVFGAILIANSASAALPTALTTTTLEAAGRFAVTLAAGVTEEIPYSIIALTQGEVRAMWVAKVKKLIAIFLVVAMVGAGMTVLVVGSGAKEAAAVPVPETPQKPGEPEGSKAVNGMKVTLTADKTETFMQPIGTNAKPVQLKLTFTNVSDKAITLSRGTNFNNAYQPFPLGCTFDVTGPDAESVSKNPIRMPIIGGPPDREGFVTIEAKMTFVVVQDFPSQPLPGAGVNQKFAYTLGKAGEYRIKATYAVEQPNKNRWTGKLTSNELVLTVKPAAAEK